MAGGGAGTGAECMEPQALLDGGVGDGAGAVAGGGGDLIDPANFFKEFDAWVDSKYPGDRGSATKVKVAFRKVTHTNRKRRRHEYKTT